MNGDRAPRQRTYKGGSISFDGGGIDCTIRNLSASGACLDIASPFGVPDNFTLIIKPEYLKRACEVAWRKGR
jgi:hypothetical protein